MPLIVAVRMSLSFPVLIQAIPLYALDFGARYDDKGQLLPKDTPKKMTRCWFSDGGMSSNFPMHFFDNMLPVIPTFGISLGEYDTHRHGLDRVFRPVGPRDGLSRTISGFEGLGGFFSRILDTAKGWQDSLLGELPGFRERIATINLTSDEGGLNLDMDSAKIEALGHYGAVAGENLLAFDMDEHRWRRFLVTYEKVNELADAVRKVWTGNTPIKGEPMADFIARYAHDLDRSYKGKTGNSPVTARQMAARIDALVALAEDWKDQPLSPKPVIPKPKSAMRIRPVE